MAKINLKAIWSKAFPIIKGVAPAAAAALGGPYGMLAATAIKAALGAKNDDEAVEILLQQNPEQLAKLKIAEKEIENARIQMGIDREAMYLADVQSARERHMKVQDREPARLTYLAVALLVASMIIVVFWSAGLDEFSRNILSLIIGALIANSQKGYNFFLGTSMGSKLKNEQISDMITNLEAR